MTFKQIIEWFKKVFGMGSTSATTTPTTTTTTTEITQTTTTLIPAQDEFSQSVIHTAPQDITAWPIISTLTVTDVDNKIRLNVDDATRSKWPKDTSINIHCLLYRNGKWHAGPCDFVHPLPSVKEYKILCVPDGDHRTYEPEYNEKVGVVLTTKCRHSQVGKDKFRSSIAWIVGRKRSFIAGIINSILK